MASRNEEGPNSPENLNETIGSAAARQFEIQDQPVFDEMDELEEFEDPNPPAMNASNEVKTAYYESVQEYAESSLKAFERWPSVRGEVMWIEYLRTFRASTIKAMSQDLVIDWTNFLRNRGIVVLTSRGISRRRALLNVLETEKFPDATGQPAPQHDDDEAPENAQDEAAEFGELKDVEANATPNQTPPPPKIAPTAVAEPVTKVPLSFPSSPSVALRPERPPLSVSCVPFAHTADVKPPGLPPDLPPDQPDRYEQRYSRSRIDSISKAYQGQQKYSGAFTEGFDTYVEKYETLCAVFELTEEERARAFPIMLTGAAFTHFSHHYARKNLSYHELVDAFRAWYTSEEQKYRLLQVWQRPSLEKEFQNNPDKSELEVFRTLSEELVQTQHQLHADYHLDRFLRDQLLISADIPKLRRSLIEKIPRTAQEAMQRIATLLSSEPRSASAHICDDAMNDGDAMYGFGSRFGGNARKRSKRPFKRKMNSFNRRLAKVKGCWVCGKDHPARGFHSPQEIIQAVNRIKHAKPERAFSTEEMSTIQNSYLAMYGMDDSDDPGGNSEMSDDGEAEDEANFTQELQLIALSNQEHLVNVSFMHGRSFSKPPEGGSCALAFSIQADGEIVFEGVILDTGANRISIMSMSQYQAYCREFGCPIEIDYAQNRGVNGIGGKTEAVGTAIIPIPFKDIGIIIDVRFRIMRNACPSLLCLRDMIESGMEISIQEKTLTIHGRTQELEFVNDFLKYCWTPADLPSALYTVAELQKLHKQFGHPSVHALHNLLSTANKKDCNSKVRRALERITKECSTCQAHAPRTRRFKLSIGTGPLRFNHTLAVDVMYLDGRPVLHAVDEATHFCSAIFLRKVSAEETWKALLRCWSRVYLGHPDRIRVDQGSNFVAKHFLDCCTAEDIQVLQAPIESPSTITHVERYHAPLRAAYTKIRDALPKEESDADCLQLAVKSVNDTLGPEGLCPTLLVYGTIPRPPRRTPAETQIRRAEVVSKAMGEVRKEFARRKIAFALKHPRAATAQTQDEELRMLPAGSPVRVYRTRTRKWEGPFPLVSVDNGVVVVQLPSGRKLFRSDVVKSTNTPTADTTEFTVTPPARNSNDASLHVDAYGQVDAQLPNTPFCTSPPPYEPPPRTDTHHMSTPSSNNLPPQINANVISDDDSSTDIHDEIYFLQPCESLFSQHEVVDEVFTAEEQEEMSKMDFAGARRKELTGLLQRNVFSVVKKSSVPANTRIFGTRWVESIKTIDGRKVAKARLVAQNYSDEGALEISTKSPTISRAGQRLILASAAQSPNHSLYTRDITQAYVQQVGAPRVSEAAEGDGTARRFRFVSN